jgi:hypothetical protein
VQRAVHDDDRGDDVIAIVAAGEPEPIIIVRTRKHTDSLYDLLTAYSQQRVRTLARKQDTSIEMDPQTIVLVLRGLSNSEHVALAAAKSVIAIEDKEHLATKSDLHELKVELIKWNLGAMGAMTTIYLAIVAALKFVK